MASCADSQKDIAQQFILQHATWCEGWLYRLEPDLAQPTSQTVIRCCRCGAAAQVDLHQPLSA